MAAQTLKNVQAQYKHLSHDEAVKSAYAYLLKFALACGKSDISSALQKVGVAYPEKASILEVVRTLRKNIPAEQAATEYGDLALNAAADALGCWQRDYASKQIDLFSPSKDSLESWRDLGTGSGFCQLSQVFFGKLTERYLKYFLDRVTSATESSTNTACVDFETCLTWHPNRTITDAGGPYIQSDHLLQCYYTTNSRRAITVN